MAKKKILLLSDDLRMSSGVGTMSKEFVLGTVHHYDWVQIGGAIKHPENGKRVDMNQVLREETGVEDAKLTIYPSDGYGNPDLVRVILEREEPDAILHYTDPRFWTWFYRIEAEIRQSIPIFYYNIWDDLPDPQYNTNYYLSSDLLMAISKQTYGTMISPASSVIVVGVVNAGQYHPRGFYHQLWPRRLLNHRLSPRCLILQFVVN